MERAKRIRIEWNNVSSVVDGAIMSVAISRVMIHREYTRLHQGSLASLAHSPVVDAIVVCKFELPILTRCPRVKLIAL